ncbi:hypothetical protein [Maribacter aquivivus]|uniref:hypothetical protein n=1 Tax=Maribacter aquivivus TaxID=228958 RepID=UPI002492A765|nr:hypothetical protein [Maribacter aquivivus]
MRNKNSKIKGISIVFLGPDGSGKSTIISGLLDEKLPFENSYYFHLKPLRKKNKDINVVVENPHEFPPYGALKSYLKLIVFIFQYNLGWFKNIRSLLNKPSLVIFDRYYDDLLVDFKRYRYGGRLSVANWVSYFIPKATFYFVLTTESEIIHKRKQEVSLLELNRQILGYESLVDNDRYIHIDVSKRPEEIVKQLKGILLNKVYEE